MPYRLFGRVHAALTDLPRSLRREAGQGTVEYVALIMLVSVVLAGVVLATRSQKFGATHIAETIVKQIRKAMESVGGK